MLKTIKRPWKIFFFFIERTKKIDTLFFLKIFIKNFFMMRGHLSQFENLPEQLRLFLLNLSSSNKINWLSNRVLGNQPKLGYKEPQIFRVFRKEKDYIFNNILVSLKKKEKEYKKNWMGGRKKNVKGYIKKRKKESFWNLYNEKIKELNIKKLRGLKKKNNFLIFGKKKLVASFFSHKKIFEYNENFFLKVRGTLRKSINNYFFIFHIFYQIKKSLKNLNCENFYLEKNRWTCRKQSQIPVSWGWGEIPQENFLVFFKKFDCFLRIKYPEQDLRVVPKKRFIQINGVKYEKLELIGKGGTGKVYKIVDQKKNLLALKKVKIHSFRTENLHGCINEISILKILQGNIRVVQLKNADISIKNGLIYMVFEYGECDLNRLFKQNPISLSKDSFLKFLWKQILETVQAIHQEKIVHGDLKPANFLIIEGSLKIIDFGIAKPIQNDTTNITRSSQIGTLNYMPPESVLDIPTFCERKKKFRLSRSADIWSLGCIFFQMVYGKPPFHHLNMMKKIQAIVNKSFKISFLPLKSFQIIDVLKNCLQRNPDSRPSIPELLKHPFFLFENLRISIKKENMN
mmetsp:Transcript_28172/g.57144  ORF Transcript_28172/g.57144 Transcript_28172/m.57144 type:complete len:571 (+) Transcript_28172:2017-3729(+)